MNYRVRLVFLEDRSHRGAVADIVLFERKMRTGRNQRQRCHVAGIRQFIDHDDVMAEIGDKMTTYRRSDKTGSSSHDHPHCATSSTAELKTRRDIFQMRLLPVLVR